MMRIRSILWIGRGDELGCGIVADAPSLDVAWAADLEDALALPLGSFEGAVVDARDAAGAAADLRRLRRLRGAPSILVRIDAHDAPSVPALLAAGAADVVLRSGDGQASEELVERIAKLPSPADAPQAAGSGPFAAPHLRGVVGESAALRAAFDLAARAASSQATVLVAGETGTGKELLARAIHAGGPRASKPFLAVNCAAFTETLLESELFGHVRGAFTGADKEKRGLFEGADGGTLFLDEVGETAPGFQAKLLRVLQEREVRPVGGARTRSVDVRVVAATNRELPHEVECGRFREDLYYRLAVFPIQVPPLRERPEDVLPLARHFLARYGRRDDRRGLRLSRDAGHLLQAYPWPGNVRQLDNEMQRVVALSEPGAAVTPALLSPPILGIAEPVAAVGEGETLRATLDRVEAWLLRRALDANDGRRAATARRLGLTREGLYKKMKRLGIE
jgi:transcriptional regulator with GAF, ATPase, and Fis domain